MSEKKTICVVNGERYWHDFLPEFNVRYCQLQTSQWFLESGSLFVCDVQGVTKIDGVLWRVGALRPHHLHRAVLEMIRLAGVPCVNSADSLLRGFDRLSMSNEMKMLGIPQVEQTIATGTNALKLMSPKLPCVIKIGNYHAGYGKMRIETAEQLADARDISFVADDYITVEPFIDYERDIRCLVIDENLWAMERRGQTWKANTETISFKIIDVPAEIEKYSAAARDHLGANVLGLDFLETKDGDFLLLETNDVPGLSGFADSAKYLLAKRIEEMVKNRL